MGCRRNAWKWMLLVGCAVSANVARSQTTPEESRPTPEQRSVISSQSFVPAPIPLDELTPAARERVRTVLEHPTLRSRGPLEAFHCRPALYYWLLDRPDVAVRLWRGLGAKCTDIQARGDGAFVWKDAQSGEVHWQTVLRTARQRVWYAEGRVKPGLMLPSVPVRAVVVLNHQEGADNDGKPAVRHQMDLVLHTDSRAVNLATRLFGASAPRMAEEYVGQMEMFFGALAWYLTEHPDKATALFERLNLSGGRQPSEHSHSGG
ncbi:MAG TPA: hypothetical protein VH575_00115 [Gemmataceae bacterium]